MCQLELGQSMEHSLANNCKFSMCIEIGIQKLHIPGVYIVPSAKRFYTLAMFQKKAFM